MSNILRSKNGNLSKVKYHLPAYRTPNDDSTIAIPKSKASSVSKKESSGHHNHNKSVASNGDISF